MSWVSHRVRLNAAVLVALFGLAWTGNSAMGQSVAHPTSLARSPFAGTLSVATGHALWNQSSPAAKRSFNSLARSSLTAWTPLLGRFTVRIEQVSPMPGNQLVDDGIRVTSEPPSSRVLFQGTALLRNRGTLKSPRLTRRSTVNVAGSIDRSSFPARLYFSVSDRPRGRASFRVHRFEGVPLTGNLAQARVRSASSRALGGYRCPNLLGPTPPIGHHSNGSSAHLGPRAARAERSTEPLTRALELVTDCDLACSQRLGGTRANDRIAEFVNEINTIYPEELGLTLVLKRQFRRTTASLYPASLTDSLDLLEAFRDQARSLGAADTRQLLTGRSLDFGVLGLAYTNAVCVENGNFSFGLSAIGNSLLTPIIMAHEIGHNLGASHDQVTGGIMSARLGVPPPTTFSEFSRTEIRTFVEDVALSCLPEKLPELEFQASFRGSTFRSSLSVPAGYSGCTVQLYAGISPRQQRTVLFTRDLSSGSSTALVEITNLARVRPAADGSPVSIYLLPRAFCSQGGDLEGPLRSVRISSKRPSVQNLRRSQTWLRALSARLESN